MGLMWAEVEVEVPFFLRVVNVHEEIRGCDTGEGGRFAVHMRTASSFLCSSTLGSAIRLSSFVWEKKVAGGRSLSLRV